MRIKALWPFDVIRREKIENSLSGAQRPECNAPMNSTANVKKTEYSKTPIYHKKQSAPVRPFK
jgi:hypothetical protein